MRTATSPWQPGRQVLALLVVVLVLLQTANALARPCDENGIDRSGMRLTRSKILMRCPCDGRHDAYEDCVVHRVDRAITNGVVPRSCRPRLMGLLRHTRCGRPGAVTCCRTAADGTTRAFIARDAESCRPNVAGGQACISGSTTTHFACLSQIDLQFGESACVTSPPCGNGRLDPGEDCDGEPSCPESCVLGYHMCCLRQLPPDGQLSCRELTYDSLGAIEQFGHECSFGALYAGAGACSDDGQRCVSSPTFRRGPLCCQGTGECADDHDTGCAQFTYPYGPWHEAFEGRCGSDGTCHPIHRTR